MNPQIQSALSALEAEPDNADALAMLAAVIERGTGGNGESPDRVLADARKAWRERGDFDLALRVIDVELHALKDDAKKADLLVEKGRLLSTDVWNEKEAEACFKRALEVRPDADGATQALGQIQLVRENWTKIVKKYLDEAKNSTDKQLTAGLHVSIAEAYAKQDPDAKEVEEHLKKALEIDPKNRKAAIQIERRLRRQGLDAELVNFLEARFAAAIAREEKVAYLVSLADVHRGKGNADGQLETLRRVLTLDPLHPRALKAVAASLADHGDWMELQKLLESALKARPRGDQEMKILLELGDLQWKRLGNMDAAEELYRRVRKVDPASAPALDFYREYHLERNEGAKLLAILQQVQKIEPDEKKRLQIAVEMARLAEGAGTTVEKAIDIWKSVFKMDKTSDEAAEALKRLYTQTQKWNALLELLKEQEAAIPKDAANVDGRVEKLLEVVAIYRDKLNLDVMVINTYNTILQLKPDHADALDALSAKYEQMGRWNDLIGVLQRRADAAELVPEKSRLLRRIASLWVEKFGNHNQAVKPLEQLYDLVPGDADVVARLRDIYNKRRAWKQLLDLERRELDRLEPGEEKRRKLVDMAKLAAERLGDAHEAIALWNRLLEDDPADAEALAALAMLYERDKRYAALAETLGRQRRALTDPKLAVPLLEKIGLLWSERLAAPQKAIEAYQDILRLVPGHAKTTRILRDLFAQSADFAALEALYGESGHYEELCETLLAVSERVAETSEKLRLYLRVAEIAQTKLRQPERAAKAYERILAVDGENLDAARELVPIYRRTEKWPRLLAMQEILLKHAASDEEKLELHREIRKVCEEKLGSKQLAFSWCAKAFAIRGHRNEQGDEALEAELVRLAKESDSWDQLVTLFAALASRMPEGERKIARMRQVADLSFTRLGRADEAQRWWAEVLERVPGDATALGALEQIYTQAGAWKDLLGIYRTRLDATQDVAGRVELLFKIALVEEEKEKTLDAAAKTYEAILKEEPTSTKAMRALERIYNAGKQWSKLSDVLVRQLELATRAGDVDAEVTLSHALGELFELKLRQSDAALPHYQRAFARQASHRGTLAALERYLATGNPSRVVVAKLLAPVYEKQDDAKRLADTLSILLDAATSVGDADTELSLLRRLAQLVGRRLGDADGAFAYCLRIFKRVPSDAANRRELAELADLLDNHGKLAEELAAAEEAAKDAPMLARDLAWELGLLLEERLHDEKGAEQAYRRVLAAEPHAQFNDKPLRALERILRANERWKELRDLLEQRKELAQTVDERREILFQICDLAEGVLDDADGAARAYLEVLDVDPTSQRAFKALERIYGAKERWRDLDDLLARMTPVAEEAAERATLLCRRAELHATKLVDAAGAVDLYEEAIGEDRANDTARKGLEKLMARGDLRQRVARILEPLYETDEAWPKLVTALQAQREKAEGQGAVELLGRIARIVEDKLGSRQQAFAVWREAFLIDPADEGTQSEVERLAGILDKHPDYAETLELAADKAAPHDLALRARLIGRAATLWDEVIADAARARKAWRKLLELDPTNLETARPAAQALERLYQAEESWPELIDMLRRQAAWAEDPEEKKDLLRRIGLIQEDLTQDYAGAVETHREILDGDPEDRQALDALERLHEAQDQWGDLIGVLRRRVDLTSEPDERRTMLWRIAELTETKLRLPAGASDVIAAYHAVLDENPEDVATLDALARLYEVADRPADLLEMLERRLVLDATLAERIAIRTKMATLLEGPLARAEQALERWREIVVDDPDNDAARRGLERMLKDADLRLKAAEVLEPIYEGQHDTAKLIGLHELWAEHAPDTRDRIARLVRVATLRQKTNEIAPAFDALARAARLATAEPELPKLLDGLDGLAKKGALQKQLVDLYQELAADVVDADTQERVYLTVASEARALGDRPTSREYYRRVLDVLPDHPKALDALEAIYAETKEYEALLDIYNRRAELVAHDEERRRNYLWKAAQLCEKELDRDGDAIAFYEQILSMFPADGDAGPALEALYAAAGRHADLADLLERRLGFAEDVEHAVDFHHRLGEIYEKELSDSVRAVENYRSALNGDPDHAGAIKALERFLDDVDHRVEVAEVLEPVYATRHDWRSLIRIYEIRLEAADDVQRRLALTKRIARAYEEQLEDLEAAFKWYGRVFREEPADRAIRDQLARLANILDCHGELARVYDEYLGDVYEETPASIEVLRTVATLYDARLSDVDKAKATYLRLLRHDAGDAQAFAALESLLVRAQRWNDLLEVYRDAADGTQDMARRKSLLLKMALVQENNLGDGEAAIDTYRAILDVDADDAASIGALDRLYVTHGRWHDLVELLGREIDKAGAGETAVRASLKLRLGALYEKELDDTQAAIDAYEEVIDLQPKDRQALASLERLVLDRDHRYRIAKILEPVYKAQDEWAKLVVIYDAELEFIDDKAERVALLKEIARLQASRGGNHRLSFKALARAWSEEATEGEARETPLYTALVETALRLNNWDDLVKTLEGAVDGSYDFELAARVHARVAEVHEGRRNDPASAIASWRKVVGVREDDVSAWKALERLLGAQGRPAELVKVLEKRGELSTELSEQKALAYRAADLYERTLGQPEQAIATWRHVLELDDNDRPALASLARLYQARQSWRDLAWVYQRQIELASTEQERRPLRFSMARVFETNLEDAYEAIQAYKGALDASGKDLEALQALVRLYEREALWPDLLEMLDRIAELTPAGDARDEVRYRAAKVLEEKQSELEAAIDRYRGILDDSPDNEPARVALEALVAREETREAAASVLEPLYRMRGDWLPLVALFEGKLKIESDPSARRALLADIAEIHEQGLDDPKGAFDAWGRLLADEPADEEAYLQLERLAESRGAWDELALFFEERLDAVFDPEVQRTLALKLAALYEVRLDDAKSAVAHYRKALDLGGDEMVALEALDRLLSRTGPPAELAEVVEREAQSVQEPAQQAEYLFRLGELRLRGLGEAESAIGAYRDALEREPRHAAARAALDGLLGDDAHAAAVLDILEPLAEQDGDHQQRIRLGEVRLRLEHDKHRRAADLSRLANIAEHDLHDRLRALGFAVRALAETADDVMLADEIERLAGDDAAKVAAQAFDGVLKAGVGSDTARELGLRAARLYEKLGDAAAAEARYRAVLEVDGENADALEALERILRAGSDAQKLVEILERRADAELDHDAKKRLYGEAARLRESPLDDAAGAVALWKKVLDTDESDRTAMTALASLYETAGKWEELVAVLGEQGRFAESTEEQLALKTRVASLLADKIGDADRAIDAYRDLLDLAPDGVAAMEKLESLHAARGDWTSVQEVLVRRLSVVEPGPGQVAIYRRLAEVAVTHQNSPEDAISYFQQIIEIAPSDEKAAADLEALLEGLEKWYDLIDALKQHAERRAAAGDKDGELRLLVRTADVLEEKLQSAESASEVLEQILERDPKNVRALASLARIYEAARDLERCKEVLEKAAALAPPSGQDRAELEYRLGRLEAEREGDAAAEPFYRRALEAWPEHAAAAEALEKGAREREDWAAVAELVGKRADRTHEAAARKALLVELAGICKDRLHRPADAITALEKARAVTPDDAAILEQLGDAYFAANRLGDALPVYQGLLDKLGKGRKTKEMARLHYRLGAVAEKEGKGELASQQFQAAYQIDPGHAPTLAALGRLYTAQKEWEKARRIYRSMLLQNIDPTAGISKADVYLALGEIHEAVNEAPKAVGMYERGLELEPGSATLKAALARAKSAK